MNIWTVHGRRLSRWSGLFLIFIVSVLGHLGVIAQEPEMNAHIFYYGWYKTPDVDGHWSHWNHNVILREGGGKAYEPPEDIGANFYPADGLYSSLDPVAISRQLKQIKEAGIGVLSATWWGREHVTDKSLSVLFDAAAEQGLKVCFHLEPFPGRDGDTARDAIVYLLDRYGDHPALYRCAQARNRPMVYVYDSYLTPAQEWAELFKPGGSKTIRGGKYDVAAIGLWVKKGDGEFMIQGGFDGFYTYFATEGFTYGSTPKNWPILAAWARDNKMLFIPSVAPGYCDTRIRPWNTPNTREREDGAYYDRMFEAALSVVPPLISITSFNEWHEGTQIEPAIPKEIPGYRYEDYGKRTPRYYLERTLHWIHRWRETK